MCNFTETVTIIEILSNLIVQDGQQTLVIKVSDGHRFVKLTLVSAGQTVTAHYGKDGMCAVSCDPNLSTLTIGDTIELGVAIPRDN